jgi:hypothetical protein
MFYCFSWMHDERTSEHLDNDDIITPQRRVICKKEASALLVDINSRVGLNNIASHLHNHRPKVHDARRIWSFSSHRWYCVHGDHVESVEVKPRQLLAPTPTD